MKHTQSAGLISIIVTILFIFQFGKLNAQNVWSPLGIGLTIDDRVSDITYNPNTGEYFVVTDFNGVSSDVYKLSNNIWTPIATVGNSNGRFANIEYYNGSIYVGCAEMITLNGNTINNIARYDGVNWYPVGSGLTSLTSNGQVRDMRIWKNMLVITGQFDFANGLSATNVAVVNGTILGAAPFSTSQMNLGNEIPNKMGEYNGNLILGIEPNMLNIFSIDSNTFAVTQIGSFNVVGEINSFDEFNNELYVTGQFSILGTSGILKWNGTIWSAVSGPAIPIYGNSVNNLNNELFVVSALYTVWEDYTGSPSLITVTNQTSTLGEIVSKKINGCLYFLGNFDTFNSVAANGVIRTCSDILPTSSFIADSTTFCSGSCVNFTNQSSSDSSWLWLFPGGTPSSSTLQTPPQVCYSANGSYSVTLITSNNFGTDTLTLSNYITVNATPIAQANSNSPVCAGDTLTLSASSGTAFSWSGPNGFISNLQNPVIGNVSSTDAGVYSLIVTNISGCSDSTSITVTITPNNPVTASSNSPACEGASLNFMTSSGISYSWTGPDGFASNQQNPIINNISTDGGGSYSVTITNACGIYTTSTQVIVNPSPTATVSASSTSLCDGGTLTLNSTGGLSYSWTGPNNFYSILQSPTVNVFSIENSGIYSVIVTNSDGCTDTDSIGISLSQNSCFFIPSVFTPNSDGSNDLWIIEGIDQFPNCTVIVFDRWGQELYNSKGYSIPWDGTFDGKNCPIADYYYIIDLKNGAEVLTGTVTIKL